MPKTIVMDQSHLLIIRIVFSPIFVAGKRLGDVLKHDAF